MILPYIYDQKIAKVLKSKEDINIDRQFFKHSPPSQSSPITVGLKKLHSKTPKLPNPTDWHSTRFMAEYSNKIIGPDPQIPETAIFYRKKLSYLDDGRYCKKIRVDLKDNIFENYLKGQIK